MRILLPFRCGCIIGAAVVLLEGCGGGSPVGPALAGGAAAVTSGPSFSSTRRVQPDIPDTLLYSFTSSPDGANPDANLIDDGGTLYGTTTYGGKNACFAGPCGTVFSSTLAGAEAPIYSFKGSPDGAYPVSDLVNVGGTLYGTTTAGGTGTSAECYGHGCGTVFSITTAGSENVIYSFKGASNGDGSDPSAGLVYDSGTGLLYGTTIEGGTGSCTSGCGTVFSISTAGAESPIYSFKGGTTDGVGPIADLADVGGTLYGTTEAGGAIGAGIVFSVSTSGTENWIYSFAGSPNDGFGPFLSGMIDVNGTLYGTTSAGGTSGAGTVFSITTAGVEHVVCKNFGVGADSGLNPEASLIYKHGLLYGTTYAGGSQTTYGQGTVFKVKFTGGRCTVIHRFAGSSTDGNYPQAGLINIGGTGYGTTLFGGSKKYGAIYSIAL